MGNRAGSTPVTRTSRRLPAFIEYGKRNRRHAPCPQLPDGDFRFAAATTEGDNFHNPKAAVIIMKPKETCKRYILFIISLLFSGIGVAFTKTGALGVSPISSLANVMSIRFPVLSIGEWLIVTNCVLIVGQILLLGKKFRPIELLQVPLSFLFGYFTDFGMWIASFVPVNSYPMQLLWLWRAL